MFQISLWSSMFKGSGGRNKMKTKKFLLDLTTKTQQINGMMKAQPAGSIKRSWEKKDWLKGRSLQTG